MTVILQQSSFSVQSTKLDTPTSGNIKWPAKWLNQVIREIQSLSSLKDNWDSYNASRIDAESIYQACKIADQLARMLELRPMVSPTPIGNVNLSWSWNDGDEALEMEVYPSGYVHALYTNANRPTTDVEYPEANWADVVTRHAPFA